MWSTSAAPSRCLQSNMRQRDGRGFRRQWHESNCGATSQKAEDGNRGRGLLGARGQDALRGAHHDTFSRLWVRRVRSRFRWRLSYVGGLVHYRGDVLTTVSLRQLLALPPRDGSQDILVLESTGGCFGLLVDSVGEVLTVSAAEYEPNPSILDETSPGSVGRGLQTQRPSADHARPRAPRSGQAELAASSAGRAA